MDTDGGASLERYREIANELRDLVPKVKSPEAADELRLLALSYDKLAEHSEVPPNPPKDTPAPLS